jgi:hypothetical protein
VSGVVRLGDEVERIGDIVLPVHVGHYRSCFSNKVDEEDENKVGEIRRVLEQSPYLLGTLLGLLMELPRPLTVTFRRPCTA